MAVAIRRGLQLTLEGASPSAEPAGVKPGRAADRKRESFPLRSAARSDPDTGVRTLRLTESVPAFRFDLLNSFEMSKLGLYRLRLALAGESGVGPRGRSMI